MRAIFFRLAILLLVAITAPTALLWGLSRIHISTPVEVELDVNRIVFTPKGVDAIPIFNPFEFRAVSFENFSTIKLTPVSIQPASLDGCRSKENSERQLARTYLQLTQNASLVIDAENQHLSPTVSIERSGCVSGAAGQIHRFYVATNSDTSIEVNGIDDTYLTVNAEGTPPPVT